MKKNSLLKMLFTFLLLCTINVSAEVCDSIASCGLEGAGTSASPYIITTPEQLNAVRYKLSAHYKLANDIDLTYDTRNENGKFYNNGAGWDPIGTTYETSFTGTFDGNNHVIKGMYINWPGSSSSQENYRNCAGLFGHTKNATIKNLGMIDSEIYSFYGIAAGISGYVENTTFSSVYNTGNVFARSVAGGIVGSLSGDGTTTITKSYNSGDIFSFKAAAGGIVGGGYEVKITNSFNVGNISSGSGSTEGYGDSGGAGGIVGNLRDGTIQYTYNFGNVLGLFSGGIIGKIRDTYGHLYIKNSFSVGDYKIYNSEVAKLSNNNVSVTSSKIYTLEEMGLQSNYLGFDFSGVWNFDNKYPTLKNLPVPDFKLDENTEDFAGGNGYSWNPYKISTAKQLDNIRNYNGSYFELINDIDLTYDTQNENGLFYNNGYGWEPIGEDNYSFMCNLDGKDHTISGLYINRFVEDKENIDYLKNVGLFAMLDGSYIKNINFVNNDIKGSENVGTIAGYSSGTKFDYVINYGNVSGKYVGGIVGYGWHLSISYCGNYGNMSGSPYSGGLVGSVTLSKYFPINYVYNFGSAYGGIVGDVSSGNIYITATIKNAFNAGKASSGGIAGRGSYLSVVNAYSSHNVYASGSIIGIAQDSEDQKIVLKNVYYLGDIPSIGGTYKKASITKTTVKQFTVEQMKLQSNFSGFDFTNDWYFDTENVNYPFPVLKKLKVDNLLDNNEEFAGGIGRLWNPFKIKTSDHLNNIRNYSGFYFELRNDIDLTYDTQNENGKFYNDGYGWKPIGQYNYLFSGIIYGNNHIIKGLYINRTSSNSGSDNYGYYVGLFGSVGVLSISDLGISGNISGYSGVGAFVGDGGSVSFSNVYNLANVFGNSSVSGFVGKCESAKIINSYNVGNVFSNGVAGAFIGSASYLYQKASTYDFDNIYNVGNISYSENNGELVGSINAKWATESVTVNFNNAYYTGSNHIYVSDNTNITLKNSNVKKLTFDEMKLKSNFIGFDFTNVWQIDSSNDLFPFPTLKNISMNLLENTEDFAGGNGYSWNPYKISTSKQLDNIRNYSGFYFEQINDIDLTYDTQNSTGKFYNNGYGWKPIGDEKNPFMGNFDGKNHVIKGLYINRTSGTSNDENYGNYVGLFGYAKNAIIKNLGLIENKISGYSNVGSFFGYVSYSVIDKVYNAGNVISKSGYSGGIAGGGLYVNITNTFNTGNISAIYTAGGILGNLHSSSNYGLSNVYNAGNVFGGTPGAIIGSLYSSSKEVNLNNIYYLNFLDCYGTSGDLTVNTVNVKQLTLDEMKLQSSFTGFDFNSIWGFDLANQKYNFPVFKDLSSPIINENTDVFESGSGHMWNPYKISTSEQLNSIRNYNGFHFELLNDIDLTYDTQNENGKFYNNGYGWKPIGDEKNKFYINFNGKNHIIKGLYINRVSSKSADENYGDYVGLFGYLNHSKITNVGLTENSIFGNNYVGSFVGKSEMTKFSFLYNNGLITGYTTVGGIVGEDKTGEFNTVYNNGNIIGVNYVGGIAGYIKESETLIRKSYNAGTICGNKNVGGIIGIVYRAVSVDLWDIYNVGKIFAEEYFGEIIGRIIEPNVDSKTTVNLNNVFYKLDNELVGSESSDKIIINIVNAKKLSLDEMKLQSSFSGFDFEKDWTFDLDNKYPFPVFKDIAYPLINENTTDFDGGIGNIWSPYRISNSTHLNNMRNYNYACFELENDIDLTYDTQNENGKFYNNGYGWKPIGDEKNKFYTNFNGKNHIIKGLYINRVSSKGADENYGYYVGLFGYLKDSEIKNIALEKGNISGYNYVGSIAGYTINSYLQNVFNTNIVSGNDYIGGIVGGAYTTNLEKVFNIGQIFVDGIYRDSGGIIGYASNVNINNAFNNSDVYSNRDQGGIIGTAKNITLVNVYNTGILNKNAGSIIGNVLNGQLEIKNAYYLTENNYIGSEVSSDVTLNVSNVKKLTLDEMKLQSSFSGFDFEKDWTFDLDNKYPFPVFKDISYPLLEENNEDFAGGIGNIWSPYRISNSTHLNNMRNYNYACFELLNDIDLTYDTQNENGKFYNNGYGWEPIGDEKNKFYTNFNGKNHIIKGLYINRVSYKSDDEDYVGLFGYLNDSEIKNIALEKGNISGYKYVGSIAGYSDSSTMSNVYNVGNVTGSNYVGGIIGESSSSTISNVYNTGNVTGSSYVGGIIGESSSLTINNTYNAGKVSGRSSSGSIIGKIDDSSSIKIDLNNVYYINDSSSIGNQVEKATINASNVKKLTFDEMKLESSFVGFDFENTWEIPVIDEITRFPKLKGIEFNHINSVTGLDNIIVNHNKTTDILKSAKVLDRNNLEMDLELYPDSIDDKIVISNNQIIGTQLGEVSYKIKSNYDGYEEEKKLTVVENENQIDISKSTIMFDKTSFNYTGEEIKPVITITNGDVVLTEGYDYTLEYSENINVGTASVVVTGINGYTGSVTRTFTIKNAPLKIKANDQEYGNELSQDISNLTITGLLDGHSLSSYKIISAEDVISVSDVVIVDNENNDVTSLYSITYQVGYMVRNIEGLIALEKESYEYTGSAIKPNIITDLVLNTDYSVSYSNNTYVGTGKAKIIGKGKYVGSVTLEFTITKKAVTISAKNQSIISGGTISQTINDVIVSGLNENHILSSVVFSLNGNEILLSIAQIVNSSGSNVTVYYEITYEKGYVIIPIDDSTFVLEKNSYEYTGKEIKPKVISTINENNYNVTYTNNINVGTGKLTITGINGYEGTFTKTFTITKKSVTLSAKKQELLYGQSVSQTINDIDISGLNEGHNLLSINYSINGNQINISSAKIIDTSNGNVTNNYDISYIGNTYSINISNMHVTLGKESYTYDGKAIKPNVITDLVLNTDYSVSYSNNKNAGTGSVTITGKGKYIGSVTKEFVITKKVVTISAKNQSIISGGTISQTLKDVVVSGLSENHILSNINFNLVGKEIKISNAIIKDTSGNEVTSNYEITYQSGTYVTESYKITSESLNVDKASKMIYKIGTNTSSSTLISKLESNDTKISYKLLDKNKNTKTANVFTGDYLKVIYSDSSVSYYELVVTGDVSGDGNLSLTDIMKLAKYVYTTEKNLSGAYFKAADYDYNEMINLADIMKIARTVYKG